MTSQRQGPPLLLLRAELFNPLSAPSFFQKKNHVSFLAAV